MTSGQTQHRLFSDPDLFDLIVSAANNSPQFLLNLAAGFRVRDRYDDALDICALILTKDPHDLGAMLMSVEILSKKGQVEQAIELLLTIRRLGMGGDAVGTAITAQLYAAAELHQECVISGQFTRALCIARLLVQLCPGIALFERALVETLRASHIDALDRAQKLEYDEFSVLSSMAASYQKNGDHEAELEVRLAISQHLVDQSQTTTARLTNLAHALSRALAVEVEPFRSDRIELTRRMLHTVRTLPATDPMAPSEVIAWESTMRQLLSTIDLAAIFDPPGETHPSLPIYFFDTNGASLEISAIATNCRQMGVRTAFFTSASEEYFLRYAETYVSSILNNCDCSLLIFVCICTPVTRIPQLTKFLNIKSPQLIFCSDNFNLDLHDFQIYDWRSAHPTNVPAAYYASSALLRVDCLLTHLAVPTFVSGIDTVLQHGVIDLLERWTDADVVFNKIGGRILIGSQLVNNLVLTYPTKNCFLFVNFLKHYLGGHLMEPIQAVAIDQVDLHMAKHHLVAHGSNPNIQYFDRYDINNDMFNHDNHIFHLDYMRKYRFLNMFVGGCPDNALTAEDVKLPDRGAAAPANSADAEEFSST